jgi:hypothetical protein
MRTGVLMSCHCSLSSNYAQQYTAAHSRDYVEATMTVWGQLKCGNRCACTLLPLQSFWNLCTAVNSSTEKG